jgi:allophanate hydrolase
MMTVPSSSPPTETGGPLPTRTAEQAAEHVRQSLERIAAYPDPAVWIHRLSADQVYRQLDAAIARLRAGLPQPLFGLTFAIKDNIDLAGAPTTAACPDFAYVPERSATVVSRLCDAGAIAMGKANLDQFATGLVGVRSPYGAVRNPFDPAYVAGGSSSGSAVAVAAGLVDFSLGTDTAGSGRVPAGFCNLVGVKPTRGLLSNRGVVPACRSLDCVSIFAHTCDQAAAVLAVAAGFDEADPGSRRADEMPPHQLPTSEAFRFGVPRESQLQFFGDDDARSRYRSAIDRAVRMGGVAVDIDFAPFLAAAALLYDGPWVAERTLACGDLLGRSPESLLPVLRTILARAARFNAADVFVAQHELLALRRRSAAEWRRMDALLLPTTGTIYRIADVLADPVRLNSNLGYYTNFVNLLDLAALAVPNGFRGDGLPTGVTWMAPAGADAWLLQLGRRFAAAGEETSP